jgi:hypothetical protein
MLAILSLAVGLISAVAIACDEYRRPQHMWIMNLVWPLTALFGGGVALWGYFRFGRTGTETTGSEPTFGVMVGKAATHCGSGCTLGDLAAEWLAFAVPTVAAWFGWRSIFSEKMFAVWIIDFIFAFLVGVLFQYFTIKPMRHLTVGQGIVQALKADTLSLTSWQVGMYAFMAFAQFVIFRQWLGIKLEVATAEFWFAMQIAMMAGFVTSYPVNWWLLKRGIKERM